MASDFFELYKHPLWQKRRREIIEKANYKCEDCGVELGLQVHHIIYLRGKKPWEYGDELLRCFCDECHEVAERIKNEILTNVGRMSLECQEIIAARARALARTVGLLVGDDL